MQTDATYPINSRRNTLSKSRLVGFLQCPKRLWLDTFRHDLIQYDDATQSIMGTGSLAGEVARELFPSGLLIEGDSVEEKIIRTKNALQSKPRPLYEATFMHENVCVQADILLPGKKGHTLIEVKSATSCKPYHLQDIAIQTWVLRGSGLNVTKTELACINNSFVYQGDRQYQGLFRHENVGKDIKDLLRATPVWVKNAMSVLALKNEPEHDPGDQCYDPFVCPFLEYCAPVQEQYPVERIPFLRKEKAKALRAQGYADIRDIPETVKLSPQQFKVLEVTCKGKAVLDKQAAKIIKDLPWPRYYLDFETVQFTVPIWKGTSPYKQIPFQWSCHVEIEDGKLNHYEFLANGVEDPRRDFAENLLACVGKSGPIIVYNEGFEKMILRNTATTLPDLAIGLHNAEDRVFDLLAVARAHYYHPEMRGSWSIKKVLPTIDASLNYADLEVGDGTQAQSAFLSMRNLDGNDAHREEVRNNLLSYCERDTLAMVRIAHFFAEAT